MPGTLARGRGIEIAPGSRILMSSGRTLPQRQRASDSAGWQRERNGTAVPLSLPLSPSAKYGLDGLEHAGVEGLRGDLGRGRAGLAERGQQLGRSDATLRDQRDDQPRLVYRHVISLVALLDTSLLSAGPFD